MQADLILQLALVTDYEAETCLNGLLKGLVTEHEGYAVLFDSSGSMQSAINEVSPDAAKLVSVLEGQSSKDRIRSIRAILVDTAEDEALRPRLQAWFANARPTLLEPVSSSLIMAGIIFVMSTHVKIEYENVDGKKNFKLKVEKKPTAVSVLQKLLARLSL